MDVATPQLDPGTHLRGMRLTTSGLSAALGIPGGELRDTVVDLDQLFGAAHLEEAAERVWNGRFPTCIAVSELDSRSTHAVRRLTANSAATAGEVSAELGLSDRQLRRLLLARTGLEPRALRHLGRLHRFLRMTDDHWPTNNLADVAHSAGYADQAHLARDVRRLCGLPPTELMRERRASTPSAPPEETQPRTLP